MKRREIKNTITYKTFTIITAVYERQLKKGGKSSFSTKYEITGIKSNFNRLYQAKQYIDIRIKP